jgi:hypothetical protein
MSHRVSFLIRRLLITAVVGVVAVPTLAVATDDPAAKTVGGPREQRYGRWLARGGAAEGKGHGERGGERAGKLSPEERQALRERVQQKIQTYLTVELSARAGLDEKKSLQLGAALKSQMQRRQALRERKQAEMKKLRELVEGAAGDAALRAQVKAVVDHADREEQLQALLEDTAKFLTPLEQAKVVVAWPEVMKEARRLIAAARRDRFDAADDE